MIGNFYRRIELARLHQHVADAVRRCRTTRHERPARRNQITASAADSSVWQARPLRRRLITALDVGAGGNRESRSCCRHVHNTGIHSDRFRQDGQSRDHAQRLSGQLQELIDAAYGIQLDRFHCARVN